MTQYLCTYVGIDSAMFTEGRIYQQVDGGENQPTVRDNLGRLRVIGHDLSFIVCNDALGEGIYRAEFLELGKEF